MTVQEINRLITSERALCLYFTTTNCSVCKVVKPRIRNLMEDKFPMVRFEEILLDKNPSAAREYSVFTAPTIVIYFEGKEWRRKSRVFSVEALEKEMARPYKIMSGH